MAALDAERFISDLEAEQEEQAANNWTRPGPRILYPSKPKL
jgi:hypothetical protein